MAINVIMPKLGLTMENGTISKWLKKEGDEVKEGEPLVEIITDKITYVVESPGSGKITKILFPEETVVNVTDPIAIIE
ncbi:MAG: biotin/lipoyl-containing protein [Candidatus Firestonebacteria bacterium]